MMTLQTLYYTYFPLYHITATHMYHCYVKSSVKTGDQTCCDSSIVFVNIFVVRYIHFYSTQAARKPEDC